MKFLKGLIISLLVIVILVGGVTVGGYFFIKSKYDIDLIDTVKQLKTLSGKVDETKLCPYTFTDDDMVDVQAEVNRSVENFISYTEEHGYSVNFNDLPAEMKYIIRLTDKQVGALAQTIIEQEYGSKILVANKEISIQLKQVKFSDLTANSILLNSVIKVDLSPFKAEVPNKFPFSYLKKYVPNALYISSTIKIEQGATAFSYTVSSTSLKINNLSSSDTQKFFHTLDVILKVGTSEKWNLQIGNTIANALIGNEEYNGLAYSLKDIGATNYDFSDESNVLYFVVLR